jgi:drug/metabolite transporter (DMT)-like permease
MIHLAHSKNTSISRSLMAGLACGIVAAVLNVAYSYFYRKATGFTGAALFEPLIIFIAFPLLFLIAGFIFFEMADTIKKGRPIFTILFLTLMCIGTILNLNNGVVGKEGLIMGIVLITGILIALLLPFLATHPKIFMDKEGLSESE